MQVQRLPVPGTVYIVKEGKRAPEWEWCCLAWATCVHVHTNQAQSEGATSLQEFAAGACQ